MSNRLICRWIAKFRSGQQQLKDAAHTGGAATATESDIEKVCNILQMILDSRFREAISQVDKLVVSMSSWYFKEAFTT